MAVFTALATALGVSVPVATAMVAAPVAAGVAGMAVGSALSKGSGSDGGGQPQIPQYDAKAEENKAAQQAAEANKRRMLAETDTTKTSALGETSSATTGKKTLLGQ